MKKQNRIAFRIDKKTLQYLRLLEAKTGNAKSVIIRNLIRQAAESAGLHTGQKMNREELIE